MSKVETHKGLSRRHCLELAASFALVPMSASAQPSESSALADRIVRHVARAHGPFSRPLNLLLPQGSEANLAPIISAFGEKTGVAIAPHIVPVDEVNTELNLDALTGAARYDVALPATFSLPDLVSAGILRPLDDFAARHEPAGFRQEFLYQTGDTFDGRTYGFQTDGDAYLMFYNKDMMGDPGLAAQYADRFGSQLDVPATWEELDQQMRFFHAPDAGRFGGALYRTPSYMVWEWWGRFHSKGVWPFSPDMTPQVAGDAGVAALEELLRATEYMTPGVDTMGLFDNWRRFSRGDVYANIGWGGTQKFLQRSSSSVRGKVTIGPTPGAKSKGASVSVPYFNWGWNYVVSATSDRPELAYLFCLFASTPEISVQAVRQAEGFFDPFRAEHYQDAGVIEAYTAPFLDVHKAAMRAAIPDLYLKGQADYFKALAEGFDAALQGEVTAQQALNRVAQKWELITSRADRRMQIKRWQRLRGKYPPHLSGFLRDL